MDGLTGWVGGWRGNEYVWIDTTGRVIYTPEPEPEAPEWAAGGFCPW